MNFRNFILLITTIITLVGNAQQLDMYLQQAETTNPTISGAQYNYEIALEKFNEVNTLPDTEFSVGYFISEAETRTGPQQFKLSARQMLPWFGTITARENYANAMADAEYVNVAIAKRQLKLSVSQSYYRLYAAMDKQNVLREQVKLLENYEQLALTYIEVGKASAVDLLKLQIRKNELLQEINGLKNTFKAEQAEFNSLLNQSLETPINVVDLSLMPLDNIVVDTNKVNTHPELVRFDKLYESVITNESLNQKEGIPDFGVGIDYINVAERPNQNFSDNGKDIVMPMLSVSIPLFNKKYKSVSRQNNLRQKQLISERKERENQLNAVLAEALHNRETALITYKTQLKNLQHAKDAEEILTKSYETGIIDFNDILDIKELQLKFELTIIESIASLYLQTTIINYITQ
jgi:outer membrane protein TolC